MFVNLGILLSILEADYEFSLIRESKTSEVSVCIFWDIPLFLIIFFLFYLLLLYANQKYQAYLIESYLSYLVLSSLFYLILSNTFLELYFLDKPLIILFWFSIFFISNSLLEVRFTIFYLRLKVKIKFVLVYKKLE